jgi:outer membrane receptor for ferrienterochelin and colicin
MNSKNFFLYFAIYLVCAPCYLTAQQISGKVYNTNKEALSGAVVKWVGKNDACTTDQSGAFVLINKSIDDSLVVASYIGYLSDTVKVGTKPYIEFKLTISKLLNEVVVEGKQDGIIISDLNPIKTEQITQTELKKSACCDLAGCFETQTTVQPQTTNVITNSKELRILGLSGVYNQILIDGFPLIQGLSYTYGISSIPGTLVDNIYVSKGANSVLQGFESISGQINVETKEPDGKERLLLNLYMNNFMEKHANFNYAFKKNKWSNLTSLHTVQPANKIDRDKDNFLDLPMLTRYLVANKWKLGNEDDYGWNSRIGIRFLNESRVGGQTTFNANTDEGSNQQYGQKVQIQQPEIWSKTGYRLNDKHYFVLFSSAYHQQQQSYFGTVSYRAKQHNLYTNLQYELSYGEHNLKTGLSYRFLELREEVGFTDFTLPRNYNGQYNRIERIGGAFAENTLHLLEDKITLITGIRSDYHHVFGWRVTPRTLLKYDIREASILRANIGSGWRTVNLFSENIGLLVSSRNIIFKENLQPEQAINYGFNFTQKFETKKGNLSGSVSVDYYRTDFQNQIFPDYDTSPSLAIIQNFYGKSVSNGFQTELQLRFYKRFELKVGYNFLDVYRVVNNEKQMLPFNPRHKLLNTMSFKPLSEKYQIDMNLHRYGEQRLPNTRNNPLPYQRPDFSKPYTVINAQFTYYFKKFDLYTGCENIFDFRQIQPIIGWQNPFGPYFDTSSVWGPTRGREIYAGVRYKLSR